MTSDADRARVVMLLDAGQAQEAVDLLGPMLVAEPDDSALPDPQRPGPRRAHPLHRRHGLGEAGLGALALRRGAAPDRQRHPGQGR